MTFIFDENLSLYIPKALDVLQQRRNKRDGTRHSVHAAAQYFGRGKKDPDIFNNMPKDGVLLTFDINQQRKWHERIAIQRAEVNVIYFRLTQNLTYWQMVLLFVNAWDDILKQCNRVSPFLIRYTARQVRSFARL